MSFLKWFQIFYLVATVVLLFFNGFSIVVQVGRVVKYVNIFYFNGFSLFFLMFFIVMYVVFFLGIDDRSLVFLRLFSVFLFLEVFYWLCYVFLDWSLYGGLLGLLVFVDALVFNLFSMLTPLLVFSVIFFALYGFRNFFNEYVLKWEKRGFRLSVLLVNVLAGFFLVLVPYLAFPESFLSFGVDFVAYVNYLRGLLSTGFWGFWLRLLGSDRPVFYFLLYLVCGLGFSPSIVVYYFPLFVVPFVVLTVYLLAVELGVKGEFASLLFLFSPVFTLGMYAAFLANFLAFAWGNLLIFFSVRRRRWLALLFSCLLYFTHPYTWFFYLMGLMGLFFSGVRNIRRMLKAVFKGIGITVFTPLVLDFVRRIFFKSSGVEAVAGVGGRWLALENLFCLVDNLYFGFFLHGSLTFLNFLIWFFALRGIVSLRGDQPLLHLIVPWSIPYVLLLFLGNGWMIARSLFDYPVYLLAARGLEAFLESIGSKVERKYFLLCVYLIGLNYSLRCLLNLLLA